jgi:hypothetical protein
MIKNVRKIVDISIAREPGEKIKELSTSTMAFISCRSRLTKVLVGAAREEKGSKGGGGQVRLSYGDIGRVSGLKFLEHLKSRYQVKFTWQTYTSKSCFWMSM